MSDVTGSSPASIAASVQTLRTLSTSSPTTGDGYRAALPAFLTDGVSPYDYAVVPTDKARAFLTAAVFMGDTITGMLQGLVKAAEVAASSLTKTDANIYVAYGTRISVGNISADIKRTLERIDELVENSAVGGANLLSSASPTISLRTTLHGGEIKLSPQPLDTAGLNLQGMDLHKSGGTQEAVALLRAAVRIAEQRTEGLRLLDGAINGTSPFTSKLASLQATGASELRGLLVNLFA
ncbi:MAG: hypothetical protein HQL36_07320 [Alphaproteobacteria bacterium]|nr:hypothetical protein [Alphaproteobacteria bacterium]MBF0249450.1 hypothetical protein [Alphaproteobacteria bacterium]